METCGTFMITTIALILFFITSLTNAADPMVGAVCDSGVGCPSSQACYRNKCTDVCKLEENILGREKCANNAYCCPDNAHGAVCECLPRHKDDPYHTGCSQ